jgi:hypothetical protein
VPVTINFPPVSVPFGPGTLVDATSSLAPPFPSSYAWEINVLDNLGETSYSGQTIPGPITPDLVAHYQTNPPAVDPAAASAALDGAPIMLQVRIRDQNTGLVVDTGSQANVHAPTSNITAVVQANSGSGSGGLTPTESQQLQDIWTFTQTAFSNAAGVLTNLPINQLLRVPDIKQLLIDATSILLTGQGSLLVPHFAGLPTAYGATFLISARPPGAGKRRGFKDVFSERVAQLILGATEAVTGEAMFIRYVDLREDALTVLFSDFNPQFLAYDITPGFSVVARWLILP